MEVKDIEFQFKGERNYIHGTDMFNIMLDASAITNEISNIRFTVHDFVHTPLCKLYRTTIKSELNEVADIRARCQFEVNGVTHWLGLIQNKNTSDSFVAGRYSYDETKIVSLCDLKGEQIKIQEQSPFTFIETVVAMNKYMHEQLFQGVSGKWIFARIDLDSNCTARDKLELCFRHNMNYRLTKSDVLVDGVKIGDIYFSLVKS